MSVRMPVWSRTAIDHLDDADTCPRCAVGRVVAQHCATCGAEYASGIGTELWAASQEAARALRARQDVLERVPVRAAPAPVAAAAPVAPEAPEPASAEPAASATVQSVLAVAGAGLVAIAAAVFTFVTPDLTDRGARTVIVAVVAAAFLAGATLLAHRRLRFSAEAVGGLGLVFLGLVVSSLSGQLDTWAASAIGTAVGGAGMLALAAVVRLRVWSWTSLLALATVPLQTGLALGGQSAVVVGALGSAAAAFALVAVAGGVSRRFGASLAVERITLTLAQALFAATALVAVVPVSTAGWIGAAVALLADAALSAASGGRPGGAVWSAAAGAAATAAFAVAAFAILPAIGWVWVGATLPAAAAIGLVVVTVLVPVPRTTATGALRGGALVVLGFSGLPALSTGAILGLLALADPAESSSTGGAVAASAALGLVAVAAGLALFGVRAGRGAVRVAGWVLIPAALVVLSAGDILLGARLAGGIAVAAAAALLAARPRLAPATRMPLVVGAHAIVLFSAILSVRDAGLVVPVGAALVASVALLARTVPGRARFVHTAVGYGYALFLCATALALLGVSGVALLCLTTVAGGLAAIAATFLPVRARSWYAVLAVTAVPFLLGIAQVVFERSGWTALSTGVVFLLAVALVTTSRAGLGRPVRAAAAAVLVPALAVVVVCLGAQFLRSSGSPVVLPVIAAIVALALSALGPVRAALSTRIGASHAALATRAIEATTLLTAAITVALALVRDAAGLGTALVVLLVLAAGATASAFTAPRPYTWWLAAASATGALWCVWGLAGVVDPEPFLLPPALAAVAVALVRTIRGARTVPLYAAGLAVAIVPVLGLLLAQGGAARTIGLLVAAAALALAGDAMGRHGRLRPLTVPTLIGAIVAAAAGSVQAIRWGTGADAAPLDAPTILPALAVGATGAVIAAVAGRRLNGRWATLPAAVFVGAAAWPSIGPDPAVFWTLWALMLGYLVALLVTAARPRTRHLPPVWTLFGLAFVTAVVAWSPRELRVEWFSLPLGLFLLAAGAIGLRRRDRDAAASLAAWPHGRGGSWTLLGPGLVVALSASMAATYTDPQTWRAILVIGLALAAIVVGAATRLAAPFVIGIVVLPVENVFAFLVQIGRGIEAMPWWITLSVVGAVLLTLAVTSERRSGADAGIAARLRDLR